MTPSDGGSPNGERIHAAIAGKRQKRINVMAATYHGKGLTGDKSDVWRYRIDNYRIIADIQEEKIIILMLDIGHRNKVYK